MALTYGYQIHKRTGLKILGGGGADTNLPGARTSRGVRGHASQEHFEK